MRWNQSRVPSSSLADQLPSGQPKGTATQAAAGRIRSLNAHQSFEMGLSSWQGSLILEELKLVRDFELQRSNFPDETVHDKKHANLLQCSREPSSIFVRAGGGWPDQRSCRSLATRASKLRVFCRNAVLHSALALV